MSQDPMIVPVILSGGSGTRLWPLSRPEMPKQLLALTARESMMQLTAKRTAARSDCAPPLIVASARHADLIQDQLAAVGEQRAKLILEPMGRNRSEEHTSELQSLMRISYAVFCLKKKKKTTK